MKFDKMDLPSVREEGVNVGPASQLPITHVSGAGAIVEGTQDVAAGTSKLAGVFKAEEEKADSYAAESARLGYAREAGDLLYDSEKGYLTTQGQGALNTAGVHEKLEQIRQKYGETLQSEGAKRAYGNKSMIHANGFREEVERHAGGQRRAYYKATADATVNETTTLAVRAYSDPKKIETVLGAAFPTLTRYWQEELGLPDKEVEKFWQAFQSDVYGAVLSEYQSRKQSIKGQEYFELVKDDLGPDAAKWREHFNKLTDAEITEQQSTEAWTLIRNASTEKLSKRFDEDKARRLLVEWPAEQRTRIESEIEREIDVAKRLQAERDIQRLARLSRRIRETGRLDTTAKDYTDLDDIGKDKAEADAEGVARVRSNDAAARRYQKTVNDIGLNKFLSLAPDVRAAMTDDEIMLIQPGMDEVGITNITKHRQGAVQAEAKGMAVSHGVFDNRVSKIMPLLAKQQNGHYASVFKQQMDAWFAKEAADGKDPTEAEVSAKLGEALLMLDNPGWFMGNVPAYMASEEARAKWSAAPIEDQPFEEAREILRKKAGAPTAPAAPAAPVRKRSEELGLKPGDWYERQGNQWIKVKGGN
jgi:hypothetical protein